MPEQLDVVAAYLPRIKRHFDIINPTLLPGFTALTTFRKRFPWCVAEQESNEFVK